MRDYTGLLEQFLNYAGHYDKAGRKPSEADIETFIDRFLRKSHFTMEDHSDMAWASTYYYGAKRKNPKTGEQLFRMEDGKTTEEYKDEIRPIVIEAFKKAYGEFGIPMHHFNPKPFIPVNEIQRTQYEGIQSFMRAYNQLTLPFRLRKTMHTPLRTKHWTANKPEKITRSAAGDQLVLRSESDIQDFMSTKNYKDSRTGGKHHGLKQVTFMPHPDGKNPKFGIIDLDNHAALPLDEYNKIVYDIAKEVIKIHPDTIVQFTGRSFQIWFGVGTKSFTDMPDIRNYIKDIVGEITKHASPDKDVAVKNGLVYLDLAGGNKANQAVEMFFGPHFKEKIMESSGLIRVPVEIKDIKKFEPDVDAHPSHVFQNFEQLKAPVDKWFTSVGIGEGYTELGSAPECFRTNSGDHDKKHPLTIMLEKWKKSPPWNPQKMSEIGEEVLQHPELVVMPKYDGWASIISYHRQGGFKVHGKRLDVTRKHSIGSKIHHTKCFIL